ncbi:MAG: hypothetical protein COA85_03120 [Robiginitomaculum sp.]|nr:MAG: hypothetical protein COA85_03120 [Robiginitomaculum sp.]
MTGAILLWIIAVFATLLMANPASAVQGVAGPIPGAERHDLVIKALAGKRAGLIVNQSSRVGDRHLVDVLLEDGIQVRKLFAVEHGIFGTADAGATLNDTMDARRALPVISIYGKKKAPTKRDVENLDVLVFDLQDVGVRFYTYLSSLHYVMQSCARFHIPLVLLDRPNPNITFVDGPILEPQFQSFVGMHPIPVLHGMTLGELARMINGEGWLGKEMRCDLTVIPVAHYTHSTLYRLPVRPSPNLPNAQSIRLYPSLALFEATTISVGRGTDFPFQVLGGTRKEYGNMTFTPHPVSGAALHPKQEGKVLYGQDLRQAQIAGLKIEIFLDWYGRANALGAPFLDRPDWLDKLMGTDHFRKQVQAGKSAREIRASWQKGLGDFKRRRAPYLLYFESGP